MALSSGKFDGGDIGRLIHEHDWTRSPLGPPSAWPQSLRNVVALMICAKAQIVLFWGPDYVALYNDAYAPTIGDKHPAAFGRPARENWSELWDDLEPLLAGVYQTGRTVSAKDRPFEIERRGYRENVFFDISYSPAPDDHGGVGGVLCIVSETTERVLTERRLKESEHRFRNMADNAPVMMWVTDSGGACEYLNQLWSDFTGQKREEALGFGWLEATHPDDRDRAAHVFHEANERQESFVIEYRLRRADGSYRWVIDSAAPRLAADGAFLGYIGSVIDIDDRHEAEERMRESEGRLQAVTNSIDQMIWSTRPDGHHDYYNARWYEYTGVPEGTTDGDGWNDMFHPEDQERAWSTWRRSLSTGEPYQIEYRLRHRSGAYRWVLGRAQPVRDRAGRITRWFGTCTDI
ncbi:MAG TPA: PAS domain S-box protein, partial [Beijerinckiaceae bacterium]